jgi:short-subunit dehydrogenase
MKKPEDAARLGIDALFNKRAEYIPGFFNKLVLAIVPLIPAGMISYIYRKVYMKLTLKKCRYPHSFSSEIQGRSLSIS